jgi:hypothetical protein
VKWLSAKPRVRSIGFGLAALLLCSSTSASGAPEPSHELVILLVPTNASVATHQSLSRMKDELSADRFQVVLAAPSAAAEPGAVIESAMGDRELGTIIALFGDPGTGQSELCVVGRVGRRTAVRRTLVIDDPERMPQVLSLRALELLRATALELSIETGETPRREEQPRSSRAGTPARVPAPRAMPKERAALSVDTGAVLWQSLHGPPPMLAPVARLRLGLTSWFYARLSVAGLGSQSRVETAYGSASVSQNLMLFELATAYLSRGRIRPIASLGSGVLEVSVVGTGAAPYRGREAQQWSAAIDAGLGIAFEIVAPLAVAAELHGLLASPHPAVRFVDTRAATIGYPSMVASLALEVTP